MKHRDIYDRDIYEDIYETCLLLHCKGRQVQKQLKHCLQINGSLDGCNFSQFALDN